MSSDGFLKRILVGFADSLQPLREAVASSDLFAQFLSQFGWTLSAADLQGVTASLTDVQTLGTNPSAQSVANLTADLVSVSKVIRRISESQAPVTFTSTFPRQLLDYLVYFAVAEGSPPSFALLHFVGVLRERQVPADGNGRAEYVERQVHWERLGPLADQPLAVIQQTYGWGMNFDADAFLRSLGLLVRAFGGRAGMYPADRQLVYQYFARGSPAAVGVSNLIVSAPFLEASVTSAAAAVNAKAALLAIGIPAQPNIAGDPDGLVLMPVISGTASDTFPIADNVTLTLGGDFLTRPVRAELHPTSAIVHASGGDSHVAAATRIDAKTPPGAPWIPIGSSDSSRLELSAAHVNFGLSGQLDGDMELTLEVGLDAAAVVIDFSEGDSLMQGTVSKQSTRSPFSLAIKWSSKTGFALGGQPKLQINIPVQESLGGVAKLQQIGFALGAGTNNRLEFDAMLTATTSIGPVTLSVKDVGLAMFITPSADTDPPGVLGNIDLGFGFKPPSGVGFAVDVAGLVGGGFLDHEEAKKEYAGLLQLEFHSRKLTAFGLIATILPTGPGYSLIAMVDADFPPIQLGLGFMLTGAGGLMGVHRTANVDAMRAALTAHTLSNLLFPKDPIANAPQLLTELDTLFPPANGRFLFGPLARIEWGAPALLTVDLALLLELPDPVRLVLIAELTVLLPTPDEKLVEIHVSAVGAIDFGASTGSLDAVLHDSRLMRFTLHGAMALRVAWSGKKTMLLAVGGVHPKFQPPPGFPKLDRIGISMPSGNITKLNLDGYLAITTNTLQIGAHIDIFVGVDGFGIAGYLNFDTLIQRHPFHFDGDISGGVTLSFDGEELMALRLNGSLTGPGPWHAAGWVSFDFMWCTVTKSFAQTFGDVADGPPPEQIDVGQLLRAALGDARNFTAGLPPEVPAIVSLKTPPVAATGVLAHPGAFLSVHQTVVPLGLDIAKFGGAKPLNEARFDITGVSVDGATPPLRSVLDDFAPAQFLTLSDDDKLASPSFERLAAGVEFDGETIFGAPMTRTVAYQTFLVDTPDGPLREEGGLPAPLPLGVLWGVLVDGAAGRAHLATSSNHYAGPRHVVMPAELDFVVATKDQLTVAGVGAAVGLSYSQARAALDAELALHPERASELLVTARYEVAS